MVLHQIFNLRITTTLKLVITKLNEKGYILFITKFIGSSPNFNDASPNIEIWK